MASSLLRIKEVEISFDADLIGLTEEENEKAQTKDNEGGNQTGRGGTEKKSPLVSTCVAVCLREKPEQCTLF